MKHAAPVNASRAALHLVAGGLARGIAAEARLAMEVPVDLLGRDCPAHHEAMSERL